MHNWQSELQQAYRDPHALLAALGLSVGDLPYPIIPDAPFSTLVTQSFVDNMHPGDPYDPLLLQVLPRATENLNPDNWPADALEEASVSPVPGLLHKYHGRVLLLAHGSCAINCRYCFRRNFPYPEHSLTTNRKRDIIAYLEDDPSITEVILSGGEPLLLNNQKLRTLLDEINNIGHIRRIRIHTRLPVVLPQRFDAELCAILTNSRCQVVVVWHANHAAELGGAQIIAAQNMADAGVIQLNQSVILAGVNADAQILSNLSERLFTAKILPYYLHVLDKVAGTSEFWIADEKVKDIYAKLQAMLPGYLVPKLVREEPLNTKNKVIVG